MTRRIDHDARTRQAFADVVVGIAFQRHAHATGYKGAEALAGRAVEMQLDGVMRQAGAAVTTRDLIAENGADGAIDVAYRHRRFDRLAVFQRVLAQGHDGGAVERLVEAMVLVAHVADGHPRRRHRLVKNLREIETLGLPVIERRFNVEQIDAANQLIDGAHTELGHVFAHFFGDVAKEILDEFRFAVEFRAQALVLGRDADRTGVEMADAHHHAAQDHQGCGREAVFLGAEHGGDDAVAAGLELSVDLHDDAVAQLIGNQHLLGFRQAEFPRHAGVFERSHRRSAGTTVIARDQHHIGMGFGDTGRDRADADFGDQLDVHARHRIGVLEIVDELRQVFDRIDVVMGRRRNQTHTRGRVTGLGNPRIDLVAGQLAAFAGLRALRHFDLQVVGIDQVFAGHAKTTGSDLLDRAAAQIAIGVWCEAFRIFATFTGVGAPTDAVHGDGQSLVRFGADRAIGHRAGREALHDGVDRLDFS